MAALIRGRDWTNTALGAASEWSASLHYAVSMCLEARTPAVIWWGRDHVLVHNDAHFALLNPAARHAAVGRCGQDAWPEGWPELQPMLEGAWAAGGFGPWTVEHRVVCQTGGVPEERIFVFTYVSIRDESGRMGGVFGLGTDVTAAVVSMRRLQILEDLSGATLAADTPARVCQHAAEVLARCPEEVPFALMYLGDNGETALQLVATAGVQPPADGQGNPDRGVLALSAEDLASADGAVIDLGSPADDSVGADAGAGTALRHAYVRTFERRQHDASCEGCFVIGLNPLRPFDAAARAFLDRLVDRTGQALHHAADCEAVRNAMIAVAEADGRRAAQLGQIAHELRTPLNAILGWAQVLETGMPPAEIARKGLEAIQRNAWRQKRALDHLTSITTGTLTDEIADARIPRIQPRRELAGTKILVVDDEPDVRTLLRHVLADAGADSLLAESVQEAMECVARQRPDLIVSDIGMPGEDGYDLVRRIRALPEAEGGNTPIIALSASVAEADARQGLGAGFALHLHKPVDCQHLVDACARVMGQRGQRGQRGERGPLAGHR